MAQGLSCALLAAVLGDPGTHAAASCGLRLLGRLSGRLGLARPAEAGTAMGASQASQSPPPSFQPDLQPLSSPKPALEALSCLLGRRGTLRSVRGDGEQEHDVHPKTQSLGVICSGRGSKTPFHF